MNNLCATGSAFLCCKCHIIYCHERIYIYMEKELDKHCHQIFRICSLTKYLSLQVNEVANFQGAPEVRDQLQGIALAVGTRTVLANVQD